MNVFFCRAFIKECVNAKEDDVLIFTGPGSTAAIHKLIRVLEMDKMDPKKTVSYPYPIINNGLVDVSRYIERSLFDQGISISGHQ